MKSWLWDTSLITAKADVDEIKLFLEDKKIDTLFLQIDPGVPYDHYRLFITELAEMGIAVHALDGSPDWNQADHDRFVRWVSAYQDTTESIAQFQGIHLDIEPYLQSDWLENQEEAILTYQKSIKRMVMGAQELQLPFGVDIPFWFDEIQFNNQFGSGVLAKWIIQETDEITIMAYRNQAHGANGIIEIIQEEIAWADELGKQIVIALETVELLEAHTSFFDLGTEVLEKERRDVHKQYRNRSSYGGFAIHHLMSWMRLDEAEN
ncbi:MAG: amidase [Anaerobacillus sp.]|uniref:amidase n=1 Tax=Anaerobacillus sp. TaxID=1872506 RepID=UPI00391C8F02